MAPDATAPDVIGEAHEFRIVAVSTLGHGTVRLMLEGVTEPDRAEALKGKTVLADLRDLPPPKQHQFYYYKTIGCEVLSTDGHRIGIIAEVFSTGANDVFVVRVEDHEVLVPVIADIVKDIDILARRVTIETVPGLFD